MKKSLNLTKKNRVLSILVPVYNIETYLERCILSILNQKFKAFELILVDDGSTDGSGNLCDKYAATDSRIKVIHKGNEGLPSARKTGLEAAVGEFIAFVDGDDWIEYDMHYKLLQPMIDDDAIDISIGTYVIEKNNGGIEYPFMKKEKQQLSKMDAMFFLFKGELFNWSLCDKLYRRSLFKEANLWDCKISYGEDTALNWKLFNKANGIYYSPIRGYHYCIRSDSMMQGRFSTRKLEYINLLVQIKSELSADNSDLKKVIVDKIVSFTVLYLGEMLKKPIEYKDEIINYQTLLKEYIVSENDTNELYPKSYLFVLRPYEDIVLDLCRQKKMLRKIYAEYSNIYIYGAGKIAMEAADFLLENEIPLQGFVISNDGINNLGENKVVLRWAEINKFPKEKKIFVLGLNKKNVNEVSTILRKESYNFWNYGQYSINYE